MDSKNVILDDEAKKNYDEIARRLASRPGISLGKMFGMPSILFRGKAFSGYSQGEMVFKLTGADHRHALSLAGARLFDPSGRNRPMKEWIQVPAANLKEWEMLAMAALRYLESKIESPGL